MPVLQTLKKTGAGTTFLSSGESIVKVTDENDSRKTLTEFLPLSLWKAELRAL